MVLDIEHVGHEANTPGLSGVGIKNSGFSGIVVKAGDKYNFSMFARQLSKEPMELNISLQTPKGKILAETKISTSTDSWNKYTASLTPTESNDTVSLVVLATTKANWLWM